MKAYISSACLHLHLYSPFLLANYLPPNNLTPWQHQVFPPAFALRHSHTYCSFSTITWPTCFCHTQWPDIPGCWLCICACWHIGFYFPLRTTSPTSTQWSSSTPHHASGFRTLTSSKSWPSTFVLQLLSTWHYHHCSWHHYADFENLIAKMWKENIYCGVGHPNGQLTRILFEQDSLEGAYPHTEHFIMRRFWDKYRYNLTDGTSAVDFNSSADDTAQVPGWSIADVTIPMPSEILPWYVYTPDSPGDYNDWDTCEICNVIGTHDYCPKHAPKRLCLNLSVNPQNSWAISLLTHIPINATMQHNHTPSNNTPFLLTQAHLLQHTYTNRPHTHSHTHTHAHTNTCTYVLLHTPPNHTSQPHTHTHTHIPSYHNLFLYLRAFLCTTNILTLNYWTYITFLHSISIHHNFT